MPGDQHQSPANAWMLAQGGGTTGGADSNPAFRRQALMQRRLPEILSLEKAAPDVRLDDRLREAINTSLALGIPLLLTGEPGTGKTQIAHHLGWFFGQQVYEFHVKSTSTIADLQYDFDAVGYLRWAYEARAVSESGRPVERAENYADPRKPFLTPKALWEAYKDTSGSILLIDEIDKAPRDFPNDLLHELAQNWFPHPFRPMERIAPCAGRPPITIITSNAERKLPDAFLRRCVFHHIELAQETVEAIVSARRAREFPKLGQDVINTAIKIFWDLTKRPGNERSEFMKQPGLAEFLLWLCALGLRGDIDSSHLSRASKTGELPSAGVLIKDHDDWTLPIRRGG